MEPKVGSIVRAIYDFPTDESSELPLITGDIIQVKERIDKQWCCGSCNGQEGSFPIGFTIELKVPNLEDTEQLFAVSNDFPAQEEGDLTLRIGDLVVGKHPVDSNWWTGEIEGQVGIFPTTHVWRIDKELLPVLNKNKKMSLKARVKMDITAQLPEEMDLFKDEIVNIIEEVERGWYRGECNGRQGIFPASFVTIIADSDPASQHVRPAQANINTSEPPQTQHYDNHSGYDCVNSGIMPYGRTKFSFRAEFTNELSFGDGEIVSLIRHVDDNWLEGEIDGRKGIFPSNYVEIIVDCPISEKNTESNENSSKINMNLFPEDTYGRVVFDFNPEVDGDVRLKEGDTVTLIRKIDQHWYEVVTDNGETGICPDTYIEIIGSGPPSYFEVMTSGYDFPINQTPLINKNCGGKDKNVNANCENISSNNLNTFSSWNNNETNFNSGAQKSCKVNDFGNNVSDHNSSNETVSKDSSSVLDIFNDSGISNSSRENNSFLSESSYENIQDKNTSYDSSCKFNSSWESDSSSNKKGDIQIPAVSRMPSRPPPPANISSFPTVTTLNGSNTSINSARMSVSSLSSQSSSDAAAERYSDEDLKTMIQQKEQTLKVRIACRNKLENEKGSNSNSFVSNEMKTQITHLSEEIEQLKTEIADLKSLANGNKDQQESSVESQAREEEVARKKAEENKRREMEKIKKMKEQRECIITELLQTERDYLSDLKLLNETFLQNPSEAKNKGIDVPTLFGNLDDVIEIANKLLRRLTKVSKDTQLIGECFVDMNEELKEVYGHYCRNHDEVTTIIDKIDPQSPAGHFLNHKIEIIKRQTNCFDLPAMLIKPVQRILKYPLLLNELLKCTEDTHPDKPGLLQATNLMTDVATAVNEFKRRKDLVFKYRKQADTSLSGRFSKFTIHSMAKKTSRLGMRLSSSIGLKTVIKDQEFEKDLRRFTALEKSIKIFQKDMCDYVKQNEELVLTAFNMSEEIAEFYQERKTQLEVENFLQTHKTILNEHWEAFKLSVERNINTTIKLLLQSFCGPTNLIQKRYDKLLDYESATSKMEKNKDVTKIRLLQESQTMAKNTYEALNSQLVDDLPKLCDLSIEILYDCIRCFLKAKKNYIGKTAMLLIKLMDLPLLLGSQDSSILDTFQVKHTLVMDALSQLSILPKDRQSCVKNDSLRRNSSPRGSKLSYSGNSLVKVQSSKQKIKVKSVYPQIFLYTACENFDAVDLMDMSLKKGDIVGVIKQQDPMGKKLRWFVDNGEGKGFVPAKCLVKFLPSSTYQSRDVLNPTTSLQTTRNNQVKDIYAKPLKTPPPQNKLTQPQTNSLQPQNKVIQPIRPAPAITNSLRTVALSRYPSVPQNIPKPQEVKEISTSIPDTAKPFLNQNLSLNVLEHRYEEINESPGNTPPQTGAFLMNFSESSTNVIDEFDPYSTSKVSEVYDNVPDNFNNIYKEHRYEDIPDDLTYDEVPTESIVCQNSTEYYYGAYEFSPTGPNQLYIQKGQVVLVLHKCDLNSNSEWWYVEDRHGQKGYVPAAYLNKYSKDAF